MRITCGELTPALLREYPAWTWDECTLYESENFIRPVHVYGSELDDSDVLMIAASVTLATAEALPGLAVYDPALEEVVSLCFFCGDEEFGYNVRLGSLAAKETERFRRISGTSGPVFPIWYSSDVLKPWGVDVSGLFEIRFGG